MSSSSQGDIANAECADDGRRVRKQAKRKGKGRTRDENGCFLPFCSVLHEYHWFLSGISLKKIFKSPQVINL
jgi:hypothetical protein